MLDLVQSVDPVARILLSGVGILLETSILVGLVVPGDTIVLVASTAVDGPAQYIGMLVAVIVGALSGESIGFALGRFFGPKIRDSRLGRRIGITNWHRAEYYVDRRGGIAVFVSRFLPVLHSLVPVTVGMSTMRYRKFIAWTAPACVIWAVSYVTVGSVVAGGYRQLSVAAALRRVPVRGRDRGVRRGRAGDQEADRARRGPALVAAGRRGREHHRGLTRASSRQHPPFS